MLLAELERRYEAAGIRPLSAKQFTAELAAANKKLLAGSSGSKYIDTCAQKSEIENHLLYDELIRQAVESAVRRRGAGDLSSWIRETLVAAARRELKRSEGEEE